MIHITRKLKENNKVREKSQKTMDANTEKRKEKKRE
jgi:hypothetical protein